MGDCVREMTPPEKAKFILAILECGGYNMQQWERDYLKLVLQEKINILPYARKQGYQPTVESVNSILPSTGSSVKYRAKILGEWVRNADVKKDRREKEDDE